MIARLLRQKSGIDGELKMADSRKNEIQKEINEIKQELVY